MLTDAVSDLFLFMAVCVLFLYVAPILIRYIIYGGGIDDVVEEPIDHEEGLGFSGNKRSAAWKGLRNKIVNEVGMCEVCGKDTNLVLHHKIPFHVNPSLELEESNLIVLCENDNLNCHLIFGHLGNWNKYNSDIDHDVKVWKDKLSKDN